MTKKDLLNPILVDSHRVQSMTKFLISAENLLAVAEVTAPDLITNRV